MNVNLKAVWLCMKLRDSRNVEEWKGSIVNCSSMYGVG